MSNAMSPSDHFDEGILRPSVSGSRNCTSHRGHGPVARGSQGLVAIAPRCSLPEVLPAVGESGLEPVHVSVGLDLRHPQIRPTAAAFAYYPFLHVVLSQSHVLGK